MSFSVNTPGRDASPIPPLNLRAGVGLHCLGTLWRKFMGRNRLTHGSGWSSLLLFSLFLFPSVCGAEIFIEPRIGFHGVFQLGRPFPLEIELSNSGRPAEGTLEIAVWKGGATKGGAPYLLYYRRDIFLSPQSRKTVQITVDLKSFWTATYHQVRKDLRRRYPKHAWPEDPLTAQASGGPRKKPG